MMTPLVLHLTAARHELRDGYPILVLTVNGREAEIMAEAKPTLANAGIVYLGPEFANQVPAFDFDPDDDFRQRVRLEGYTRDPRVLYLWKQFRALSDLGMVQAGPVGLPI